MALSDAQLAQVTQLITESTDAAAVRTAQLILGRPDLTGPEFLAGNLLSPAIAQAESFNAFRADYGGRMINLKQ